MFLTHGDLPHEALWTAWMREAGGLLPRSSLAGDAAFCLQQCDGAGAPRGLLQLWIDIVNENGVEG